jgi:hypothetical protein
MTDAPSPRCSRGSEHPRVPVDAIVNLVNHQQQCDEDGVMVQVSRQALAEVLVYVTEVRPDNKWADAPQSVSAAQTSSGSAVDPANWADAQEFCVGAAVLPKLRQTERRWTN